MYVWLSAGDIIFILGQDGAGKSIRDPHEQWNGMGALMFKPCPSAQEL